MDMTIDELLDTQVPLPLSGPGIGKIRYCSSADLASAIRFIEHLPEHEMNRSLKSLLPILKALKKSLRRMSIRMGAGIVFDLPVFSIEAALGRKPKHGFRKGRTR